MSYQAHRPNLRLLMSPRTACPCPGSRDWLEHHPSPLMSSRHSGLFYQEHRNPLRYFNSLDMLWLMWGLKSPFCSLSLQSVSEQQLANSGRSYQNHAVHCQRSPSQHHLLVHGSGSQHAGSKWSEPHVWTRQNSRYLHNTHVKGILSIDSVYWLNENLFPKPERYSSYVFFSSFWSIILVATDQERSQWSPSKCLTHHPLSALCSEKLYLNSAELSRGQVPHLGPTH